MVTNGIEDTLLETVRELSREQKQEVLDFAVRLAVAGNRPRKSMYALWAGEFPPISEEEITEARKELWAGFPRVRDFE